MEIERTIELPMDDMEEVTPTPCLNLYGIKETAAYVPRGCSHKLGETPYVLFFCEPSCNDLGGCPHCSKSEIHIHGKSNARRAIHDVSVGVTQVDILLSTVRYLCQSCGSTFTHRFDGIPENRQYTKRLLQQIQRDSFVRPFSDVAGAYGISTTVVEEIFDSYAKELAQRRGEVECPRVLGIDEKHIENNARGVFVDIEEGTLLEMTATNKRDDVVSAIKSLKNWDTNLQIITIDMSGGYRSHIHDAFPGVAIVVDHYHVSQELHRMIRTIKTKITNYLNDQIALQTDKAIKAKQEAAMKLLHRNSMIFHFGEKKLNEGNRLAIMADICNTFPEFSHLYQMRKVFDLIYECSERSDAEATFQEWQKLVPPSGKRQRAQWEGTYHVPADLFDDMRSFSNTVVRWKNEIFQYFEPGCRVTNAATEGLNNMIERINRYGNGYSFARLRAKALYWHLAGPQTKFKFETKTKKEKLEQAHTFSGHSFCMPHSAEYRTVYYTELVELPAKSFRKPLSVFQYLPSQSLTPHESE